MAAPTKPVVKPRVKPRTNPDSDPIRDPGYWPERVCPNQTEKWAP